MTGTYLKKISRVRRTVQIKRRSQNHREFVSDFHWVNLRIYVQLHEHVELVTSRFYSGHFAPKTEKKFQTSESSKIWGEIENTYLCRISCHRDRSLLKWKYLRKEVAPFFCQNPIENIKSKNTKLYEKGYQNEQEIDTKLTKEVFGLTKEKAGAAERDEVTARRETFSFDRWSRES